MKLLLILTADLDLNALARRVLLATSMKVFTAVLFFSGLVSLESVVGKRFSFENDGTGESKFRQWTQDHRKMYESEEVFQRRLKVFQDNHFLVQQLNKEQLNVGSDAKFQLNKFADMTQEEFRNNVLMPKQNPVKFSETKKISSKFDQSLPKEFNWSGKGILSDVRDQGTAGTCWAFSAVQTIESQWALKTGKMTELSVEQVVDCDAKHDGKRADCGVFGGWPYLAYDYVKAEGGIQTEEDYSYCCGLGGDKGTCYVCPAQGYNKTLCGPPVEYCKVNDSCKAKIDRSKFVSGLTVEGWAAVSENETEIAKALISEGPLSVLINAGTLQFYRSGIWDPIFCDPSSLDHAVLLTGFGVSKTIFGEKEFWNVKNSWGKKWGEDGYFRIARNKGKCGINRQVTIVKLGK